MRRNNYYGGRNSYDARNDVRIGGNYSGHNNFTDGYYGEMSRSTYNLLIGAILLWGFVINAAMVKFATPIFLSWNPIALIIGYFVLAIIGILMSTKSDSALVSFIGYNLVVLPVGAVLSVALVGVSSVSIMNAVLVTGAVVAAMTVLGTLFPRFFLSIGRALFIALCVVVFVELIAMLFNWHMPSIWDWLVALLFSGYVAYDWAEAQHRHCDANNAVDACVGLYLDIINLFLRILSITDDD